ncbi:MAG: hypothetical protein JNL70_13380 [Saprospiraceae bacterium]|nr:hypothetical protein [Saprospiraceae bacterium]
MTNFSRTERLTRFTGNEGFSDFMYKFRVEANDGFTFIDIDTILRNHKRQTFALLEIKCKAAPLSYAQGKIFNEIHEFLKRGSCCGWTYVGFYLLQFENTSFENGKAFLNGTEVSEGDFRTWLKINF